jgi:predicted small metal-binding protein
MSTPRRVKGHKLTMSWSGEYGIESSSTGFCRCGWQESASNQNEVRHEYRMHLQNVTNQTNGDQP